jgi:hypothetical protein
MPRRHEGYSPPVYKDARPTGNFPRTGLLNPGDKAKLDKVLYGPNGEVLLGPNYTAGVGQYTGTADAHLRSGPGGLSAVESQGGSYLTYNAYYDGVNWNRYDTAQTATLFVPSASGTLVLLATSAGANPIASWNLAVSTISSPVAVDANGWTADRLASGKRAWYKRLTVNSGWPASTAWASMVTTSLPVGITNLTQVWHSKSFVASLWSRVMTIESDALTTSTSLTYHGTLGAGPGNWNSINPVILIDIVLKEI